MNEPRIRNATSEKTCPHCIDGLAEIGTRPLGTGNVPMFAPCPHCEKGTKLEFPSHDRAVWREGYWQGRDPELTPPARSGKPLSSAENLMRAKLLLRRFAGDKDADPLAGIGILRDKERLAVLSEAMKQR